MARFIRSFSRKLSPDRVLEISDRVYVLDCCVSTNPPTAERDYKTYLSTVVTNVNTLHPGASFMVFNFGEEGSQISNLLSETLAQYEMTVVNFPLHDHNGNPILPLEVIHYFLRSGDSWLSLEGQRNIILMHCEKGGWPVLGFMLAGLLLYSNRCSGGEQKAMEMAYKHTPKDLLGQLCVIDPRPSQLRYLHYVTMRNNRQGLDWPPADVKKVIDCVLVMNVPLVDGGRGCRPMLRVYGQDPKGNKGRNPQVLFNSLVREGSAPYYRKEDCALVKMDIRRVVQGDVLIEFAHQCHDLVSEEIIFKIVFHTAFAQSNILHLSYDDVDLQWGIKSKISKDFQAEVLFSDYEEEAEKDQMKMPTKVDNKEGYQEERVELQTTVASKKGYDEEPMKMATEVVSKEEEHMKVQTEVVSKEGYDVAEQMKVPTDVVSKEGYAVVEQTKVPTDVVSEEGYAVAEQMKVPTDVVSKEGYVIAEPMKVPTDVVSKEGYVIAEPMKVPEVVSKEGYVIAEPMKVPIDVVSREGYVAEQIKLPRKEVARTDEYDDVRMKLPSKVPNKHKGYNDELMEVPTMVASKEGYDEKQMKQPSNEVARKEEYDEQRVKLSTQLSSIQEMYDEELKLPSDVVARKDECDDQRKKLPTQVSSIEEEYVEQMKSPSDELSHKGEGFDEEQIKVQSEVTNKERRDEEQMKGPREVTSAEEEEGRDHESDSEFFEAEEFDMNDMYDHSSGYNQTGPFILELPDYDGDDDGSVHTQNPDVMVTTDSFKDMQLDEDDLEQASHSDSDASTAENIVMSDDSQKKLESEDRLPPDDCGTTNGSGRHVVVVAVSMEESDLEHDGKVALVAASDEESELEQDGKVAFSPEANKHVKSRKAHTYEYDLEVNSEPKDNHGNLVSGGTGELGLEDKSDVSNTRSILTVEERSKSDSMEDLKVQFNSNAQRQSTPGAEEIEFEDSQEDFKVDSEQSAKGSTLVVDRASQQQAECHPEELYWAEITTTALDDLESTVSESILTPVGESEVRQEASKTSSIPIGDKSLSPGTNEEAESYVFAAVNRQPYANESHLIADLETDTNLQEALVNSSEPVFDKSLQLTDGDWKYDAEKDSKHSYDIRVSADADSQANERTLILDGKLKDEAQQASNISSQLMANESLLLSNVKSVLDLEKDSKLNPDVVALINPQGNANESNLLIDWDIEVPWKAAKNNTEPIPDRSLLATDGNLQHDLGKDSEFNPDVLAWVGPEAKTNESKLIIDWDKEGITWPVSSEPIHLPTFVGPHSDTSGSNLTIDWEKEGITWQASKITTESEADNSLLKIQERIAHMDSDNKLKLNPANSSRIENHEIDFEQDSIKNHLTVGTKIEEEKQQVSNINSKPNVFEKSALAGCGNLERELEDVSKFSSSSTIDEVLYLDETQESTREIDSNDAVEGGMKEDTEVGKESKSASKPSSSRRRRRKPKLADAIAKVTLQRKVVSMWVPKSKEPAQETNKEKVPIYRWVPKGSTSGES